MGHEANHSHTFAATDVEDKMLESTASELDLASFHLSALFYCVQ